EGVGRQRGGRDGLADQRAHGREHVSFGPRLPGHPLSRLAAAAAGAYRFRSGSLKLRCAENLEPDRHVEFRHRRTTSHRSHYTTRSLAMRYACLIYFDPKKVFNQSPEAEAVLRAVGPHDAELKASGHLVSAIALQLP